MHYSRRGAIQFLGGAGLAALAPLDALWARTADAGALTFVAVGDWGREGQHRQRDVATQMGLAAQRIGARFVISVGDNFYETGVASVDDPAWQQSFEQVYTAPSLQVPWQVALGNHDYQGNTQAQIDYSSRSHRWRMPGRWYDFAERAPDGTEVHFFVVDTSPMLEQYYDDGAKKVKVADQRQNVPVQLAWLDHALARSTAPWKVVIGHHPIYTGKATAATGEPDDAAEHRFGGTPELIVLLDPILQRHRVPLYLNGHDHDLQHVVHDGTHYICTGAGSLTDAVCYPGDSDFCSLQSGFIACAADRRQLRVVYRDYRGAELHVVDIAGRA
ncbi:MAG: purple acid phosphatase family protein [Sphingomonas sp.]